MIATIPGEGPIISPVASRYGNPRKDRIMAISAALLKVASTDLGTASLLASMINPGERVTNGQRWAKFQKVGPRAYQIERGIGDEKMSDEVTSPAVAKMMVIQHVAVQTPETKGEEHKKMTAEDQAKATEGMKKDDS